MSDLVKNSIDLLGYRAEDRVSGFKGVISSMSFDLYGCIIAALTPPADKEKGEYKDGHWFDVQRLDVDLSERIMPVPSQYVGLIEPIVTAPADYGHGAADKPAPRR